MTSSGGAAQGDQEGTQEVESWLGENEEEEESEEDAEHPDHHVPGEATAPILLLQGQYSQGKNDGGRTPMTMAFSMAASGSPRGLIAKSKAVPIIELW
jgi:hypothetical protein